MYAVDPLVELPELIVTPELAVKKFVRACWTWSRTDILINWVIVIPSASAACCHWSFSGLETRISIRELGTVMLKLYTSGTVGA